MVRSVQCDFSSVDASGRARELAGYLHAVRDMEVIREGKRDAIDTLALRPGARALDVGCGTGEDVQAMAERVAPGGMAAGIDASVAFVDEARRRARRARVPAMFVAGDAHAMPWPDASFDAIRVERTLQHVADPAAVVAEIARVAAPGAVITASEPDWETLVIDLEPATVTHRIVRAFRSTIRQPTVGRALVRHMRAAGLVVEDVDPGSVVLRDPGEALEILFLRDAVEIAVTRGLDPRAGQAWLREAERRGAEGTFFAAATGFFVTARRPS